MRTAIISDVHANLEAYRAVLQAIDQLHVDRIFSLGDLVGYGPDPNACIDITLERDISSLLGNHDAVACGLDEPHDFNSAAREAIMWTREELGPGRGHYLRNLPEQIRLDTKQCLVHGSLVDRDQYILSREAIAENVRRMREAEPEVRVLFFGHTHRQTAYVFDAEGTISLVTSDGLRIRHDRFYLINPGSVGQPRDGDSRAAFLVYEDDGIVEFMRTEYDIPACAEKIVAAGLPPALSDRLA